MAPSAYRKARQGLDKDGRLGFPLAEEKHMTTEHPAMAASRASWSAVQRKAKQEWLDLFAEDACIEDPIGVSPLDPEGKGQRGKQAIEKFWDANIAPNTIEIDMRHSYAAGSEAAHLGALTTTFPNGSKVIVEGIFTYKLNEEGKLSSLRGYWDLKDAKFE
jgi:steroid delta-isomerase